MIRYLLPGVLFLVGVVLVIWLGGYVVTAIRDEAVCLRAGFPETRVDYQWRTYCHAKGPYGQDGVIPLGVARRMAEARTAHYAAQGIE